MNRFTCSILFLSVLLCLQANAQQKCADGEEPFVAVEQMPEFPGGQAELAKYLSKNIRMPSICLSKKRHFSGKIFISFVIIKTGEICGVEVKGWDDCPEIKAEVQQVVANMPRWKPGMQSSRPVAVKYSLPINFHPVWQE